MRPDERAADLRRANRVAGSPRRDRRRTMFAPVGPRRPREADAPAAEADMTDLALAEFVIDDDDYPEMSAPRRVAASTAEPDRVDDIDQWPEEFAVSDCP